MYQNEETYSFMPFLSSSIFGVSLEWLNNNCERARLSISQLLSYLYISSVDLFYAIMTFRISSNKHPRALIKF